MTDVGYRCRSRSRCWWWSRSDSGFTFLETLIVVTIGAIVAAIAITSITTARRGYSLQTAGITFSNRLFEARTQALKRNRPIDVTLDAAAGTLRTTFTPPGAAPVDIGSELLPAGIVFDIDGAPTLVVTFDSLGRPFNPPRTFRLRQPASGQIRTISVLSTGRVTVQ